MSSGLKLRIDTSLVQEDSERTPIATQASTPLLKDFDEAQQKDYSRLSVDHPSPGDPALLSPLYQPQPVRSKNAQNELRKLVLHLLDQLQRRSKPPPYFDSLKNVTNETGKGRFGAVVGTVLGAVRFQSSTQTSSHQTPPTGASHRRESSGAGKSLVDDSIDDEDDSLDQQFHTDEAYELVARLNEVFSISVRQGWQLIVDGAEVEVARTSSGGKSASSPFRLRRNSFQASRRSRTPSLTRQHHESYEMSTQCLSILTSLVLEDCRFQISRPRPSRPPFALQAVVLDFARFLIYTYKENPEMIYRIGYILLPAFQSFKSDMHPRLLSFYKDHVLSGVLTQIRLSRLVGQTFEDAFDNAFEAPVPSRVSIRIEVAEDVSSTPNYASSWSRWSKPQDVAGVPAASAGSQPLILYQLTSILSPLLAAILEHINLQSAPLHTQYQFYKLFQAILDSKPDVYLDLLAVVAYHGPQARHSAMGLLATYWPRSLGHVFYSSSLPHFTYETAVLQTEMKSVNLASRRFESHEHSHQFMLWHFYPITTLFERFSASFCRVCSKNIEGFGLYCPFCICAVHFDCYDYPEGSHLAHYVTVGASENSKVGVHRFCRVDSGKPGVAHQQILKEGHCFTLVNLFTLTLCSACHEPLWGHTAQGMLCENCFLFIHLSCASSQETHLQQCRLGFSDSSLITTDWSSLRRSFLEYHKAYFLSPAQLAEKSYEELSILYSVLCAELRILENGLALSSVVLLDGFQDFELHEAVSVCKSRLSEGMSPSSPSVLDFLESNPQTNLQHMLLFNWSFLEYATSVLKSPLPPSHLGSDGLGELLQVDASLTMEDAEILHHPYELATLAHLRDAVGFELQVTSDATARLLLQHMSLLGFFTRMDGDLTIADVSRSRQVVCEFPVPLGVDLSLELETLFSAVESCLSDIDLSINEMGLLLLIRKLRPNGLATDYALRRSAKALISWMLAEDKSLGAVLRDYVAKSKLLPGLRPGTVAPPWPSRATQRPTAVNSAKNGGDYIACRRSLLSRYAATWMLELHAYVRGAYGHLIFEICEEVSRETAGAEKENRVNEFAETLLRNIVKLGQDHVAFEVFGDLLLQWLALVGASNDAQAVPSLQRLVKKESETKYRMSAAPLIDRDSAHIAELEPWTAFATLLDTDHGLKLAIQWTSLFSRSEVIIPPSIYDLLASALHNRQADLTDYLDVATAVMRSAHLRSVSRQELQNVIIAIQLRLLPSASSLLESLKTRAQLIDLVRRSFAGCLLLYGCDAKYLASLDFLSQEELKELPSKSTGLRVSSIPTPIKLDPLLPQVLQSYVALRCTELSGFVLLFLSTCMSSTVSIDDISQWITSNGQVLSQLAWDSYSSGVTASSDIRSSFLVRILCEESNHFRQAVSSILKPNTHWELRVDAVGRLFRMILDLSTHQGDIEEWRIATGDVYRYFFTTLWSDDHEEVRLAVETASATFLPIHFQSVTLCWNDVMLKASKEERVELASFLLQCMTYFPRWPVISWDVLRVLLEDVITGVSIGYSNTLSRHSVGSLVDIEFYIPIVVLAMRLLAHGIIADQNTTATVALAFTRMLGFRDASPNHYGRIETVPDAGVICIQELIGVLDQCYPSPATDSQSDSTVLRSNASAFASICLALITGIKDIQTMPFLTLKSLLGCLVIIIYKYPDDQETTSRLREALICFAEALARDVQMSEELQQLILTAVNAFFETRKRLRTNDELAAKSLIMSAVVLDLRKDGAPDTMVSLTRQLIRTILITLRGLRVIRKNKIPVSVFGILQQLLNESSRLSTAETELRDEILADIIHGPHDTAVFSEIVLQNLSSYTHFLSGDEPRHLHSVAAYLTNIIMRAAERGELFDADLAFTIFVDLAEKDKTIAPQLETTLRHSVTRLDFGPTILRRILTVIAPDAERTGSFFDVQNAHTSPNVLVLIQVWVEVLRGKMSMSFITFVSVAEIIHESFTVSSENQLSLLLEGLNYLLNTGSSNGDRQLASSAIWVARVTLRCASMQNESALFSAMAHLGTQRPSNELFVWSNLLAATFQDHHDSLFVPILEHFSDFSATFHGVLASSMDYVDLAAGDAQTAFIAAQLWLLLALRVTQETNKSGYPSLAPLTIWNDLWAPLENIINQSFSDRSPPDYVLPLTTIIRNCTSELFIFLRISGVCTNRELNAIASPLREKIPADIEMPLGLKPILSDDVTNLDLALQHLMSAYFL